MHAMQSPDPASHSSLESRTFLWMLVIVTAAFVYILLPFYGAILWGTAAALVFTPLYRRLALEFGGRNTLAALFTVLIILALVILPLAVIGGLLINEAAATFQKLKSGELNFGRYAQQVLDALPAWVGGLLERFGLNHLGAIQEKLAAAANKAGQQTAGHVLSFGQNTLEVIVEFFIMLYLLFFLLRDGPDISRRIKATIPLRESHKRDLSEKFTTVIRATVKGNILVAAIQGALGGLMFAFLGIHASVLWGVVMAFLSLLPAVGAAVVWLPVAIYLVATGSTWQGFLLIAYGALVIGLIDNVLRPILVGKDTRMPDYVVLFATLGGMATFGVNGFVIGPLCAAMFMAVWHIFAAERARREM